MYRIALAFCLFAFVSCDRHEWEGPEGTQRLFKAHGDHGDHGDHGCHCSGDHDHKADKKHDQHSKGH